MSQSAKSKALKTTESALEKPLLFKSEIGLFLAYLLVRTAPLVAVVFYFTHLFWTIIAAVLLIILLVWAARHHNYQFLCSKEQLQIEPSFWKFQAPISYPYSSIQQAQIKIASRQDKRQWLALKDTTGSWKKFRCDWLHEQDPPSVDEHEDDTPQHELFELLEEEDFYQGSIQHLAYSLQQQGIVVQLTTS